MRHLVLLSIAFLLVLCVSAQNNTKEKKEKPATAWKPGGTFTLIAGQSGTRNWAPTGSEKLTLSATANLILWANKKWGRNSFDNTADLAYGMIYTHEHKSTKIEDKIDIYSKYSYSLKGITSLGIVTALRTQFTNAYDNDVTPRKRISGFFAPAYLTFSPGVQFHTKNPWLSVHAGPAVRWVIVTNAPYSLVNQGGIDPDGKTERTLAELYGVNPAEQVRFEIGAYVSAVIKKEIMKNVMVRSRVDFHSDARRDEPFQIDVYWTNSILMSVNKWLKVNYSFDLYHDKDVKMFGPEKNEDKNQVKSLLGVGLGLVF
ncbi:MAG: DUF3078 domain-containing protein [Flavisolibacter sp.]